MTRIYGMNIVHVARGELMSLWAGVTQRSAGGPNQRERTHSLLGQGAMDGALVQPTD